MLCFRSKSYCKIAGACWLCLRNTQLQTGIRKPKTVCGFVQNGRGATLPLFETHLIKNIGCTMHKQAERQAEVATPWAQSVQLEQQCERQHQEAASGCNRQKSNLS